MSPMEVFKGRKDYCSRCDLSSEKVVMLSSGVCADCSSVPVLSVAKATDNLRRKSDKLTRTEKEATLARQEWQEAILLAHIAGQAVGKGVLTVPNIAAVAGKSPVRIEQVLKAEREARGISSSKTNNQKNPKEGSNESV